jgi:hypothetical protein
VHVIHCFQDDDIQHVMGSVDPVRDREVIDLELAIADLSSVEKRLDRAAKLARAAYHLLGLQSYFTAGEKEVRAWTIHRGDTAPAAAGVIHSDFERGFIRAETVGYDDSVRTGGWKGAREPGLVRSEGKEYVVQDGDVVLFRFNV